MKKYVDELVNRINELIKVYENYLWKSDNRNLIVVFQKDMIMSFYLHDKEEIIDELYLSFEDKEDKFYKVMCLRVFAMLLGNVKVNKIDKEHNVYSNEFIKPYLAVIASDKSVANLIDLLIANQEKEVINKDNKIIKDVSKKVRNRIPNVNVLRALDERISLSKEMLRRY